MLRMGGSGLITVSCDLKENLEVVEVLWQLALLLLTHPTIKHSNVWLAAQ